MPSPCPDSVISGTSSGVGSSFGNWTILQPKPDDPDAMTASVTVNMSNSSGSNLGPQIGFFTSAGVLIEEFALTPSTFAGATYSGSFSVGNSLGDRWPTFTQYGFRLLASTITGAWTATFGGTIAWGDCFQPDAVTASAFATIVG